MADETKHPETKMAFAQRTKLVVKDIGNPQVIATLPENVLSYNLGRMIGFVSGVVERTDEKGNKFEGLKGEFRSIPSSPEMEKGREPLESGVCFLPDAFHNILAAQWRQAVARDENAEVIFDFSVNVIRAKNPIGYSWEFKPLTPVAANNRLDMLMELGTKMLAAPEKQKAIAGKK